METKVAATAPTPDPKALEAQPPVPAAKGGKVQAAPPTTDAGEMRLVIEMDQATGSYVYKTVNRQTGEVVLQLPRAEVLCMKDEGQYSAGSVIKTQA